NIQEEWLRQCASPWLTSLFGSARCSWRLHPTPRRAAHRLKPGDLQPMSPLLVAPGDGQQALATALAKRLSGMGVKQATAFEANIYDIQGTVRVSSVKGSRETVTTLWVVLRADRTQLGVTRQTNDVKKGSLDKKGGQAADAAAAAAAADIVKLLPH